MEYEKRTFIYIDHNGNVIRRKLKDSSIIHSLPRKGDEVYDKQDEITGNVISGIVQRIQFDYLSCSVTIYVKIDA